MIFIAAFEISGTYNGSDVERGLRNLQQQLNSLKAPKITPQMGNADLGAFFNAMDTGGFKTAGTKAGATFSDGLKRSLSGNMADAGRDAGMLFQNSMASSFGPGGGMLASMATALGPAGLVAGAAVASATVIGAAAFSAAKQWETLMSGVAKTTGVTGDELSKLSDTLLKLSTEIPVAQADIARIAATGGTLGIKQADLARFVTDVSMASVGWQMDAESTAQSIAGISNAFKVPIADAQKFGSVINTMADEVGGSEKEIADFLIRASGIAVTFDESIASTAAFGAVLASINMPMEVAATGLQSMMAYAMADPERMTAWADMMGISVDRLKVKLEEDLYATLIESADMIKTVGSETEQQAKRIALWGEGGARVSAGLVGMSEKYEDAQRKANDEMENGISLLSAFGAQGSTLDAKFTRFGNAMNMAFVHLGTSALPVIGDITDAITNLIIKLDSIGQKTAAAGGYIQSKLAEVQANPLLNSVVAGPASLLGLDASQIASSGAYHAASSIALGPLASLLWGTKKTAVVASESVASTGTQDGATYITALKGVLDTGIPKSVSDAYLKGVSAPAKAGQEAAQNFIEAQDAYIKAHPGGMSVSNLYDTGEKSPITGKTIYKEGTPRIIGGSDESKHEYGGLWGRGSGTIVADEEGIKYKISYSTDKFGTTSYLYIDGQLIGETREASSKEAAIQDLFSQASARDKLTKTLSLKLQGRGGEAALITETVDVELDFDVDVATKNANQSLKKFSESQNWGDYLFGDKENTVLGELEWASNVGNEAVKSAVDGIGNALQDVSLENYPQMVAGVEALNRELGDMWSGFGPRSDVYTKLQSQYADAVLAGVIDAKDLLKAQSTETTNLLADSLSDGYITGSEKGALEARKTLLGLLKERYPVEFEAAGLDELLSQIEDTLAGKKIEVQAKAIWEDWSSAAYREKFLADNPQLSALITPSQGDEWSDAIGQMAEDAENGDQVAKAALQDWQIAVQGFADGTISSMGYASEALYDLIMLYPQLGKSGSWLRTFMGGYQSEVMSGLSDTKKGTYFPYTYSIWNPKSNKGSMWGTSPSEDITVDQIESLDQIESPITVNEMGTMAGAVMGAKLATDTLSGKAVQMQPDLATTATESQNATAHLTGIESHTGSMVGLLSSIDGKIGALSLAGSGSGSQSITKFVSSSGGQNSSLGSVASKAVGGSIKWLFASANAAYQDGGVPAQSGMAWLDKGDVVIGPNSSIASKGNLPAAADTASASLTRLAGAVDKSSAAYQTTWRWFEDYAYKITAPASYKWSKYPAEPDVNVTGNVPVAWLSEGQPTGMDYIDAKLQEVIAKSVGNSLVKPWFARGYEAQPEWWTEAATTLSPKYADEWSAAKGGEVAKPPSGQTAIVEAAARQQGLTIADVWNSIYGESFTEGCIAANAPDKNLIYTPSAGAIAEAGRTWGKEETEAWSHLYGEAFTEGCISTNPPDKLLHFTPSAKLLEEMARAQGAWGRQLVGSVGDGSAASPDGLAQSIDDNTESLQAIFPVLRILNSNAAKGSSELAANTHAMKGLGQDSVLSQLGGTANAKTGSNMAWPNVSDALTTASIWSAIYDDSGTCIAYVKPDPSLNFTPGKEYQPGGKWYHGNKTVGRTIGQSYGDQALQEMYSYSEGSDASDAIQEASATASKNSAQTNALLTGQLAKTDKSNATASKSDTTLDKIEANTGYTVAGLMSMSWGGGAYGSYGSRGGSSIIGLANRGGNVYPGGFGGTSVSGMGGWVSASPGPAPGSSTAAWMNAGARAVGGSGAIQWAEGGITDHPVFGVFGEAGREAFVPISDRAAGLRILPQVMRELGIATFADGGIVQSQSITGSGSVSSTLGQTIVNGVATSQYATHSGGEPTVATGDINLTIQGDVGRTQLRDMIAQLRQEWKEERNNLVRILKQSRTGGHY